MSSTPNNAERVGLTKHIDILRETPIEVFKGLFSILRIITDYAPEEHNATAAVFGGLVRDVLVHFDIFDYKKMLDELSVTDHEKWPKPFKKLFKFLEEGRDIDVLVPDGEFFANFLMSVYPDTIRHLKTNKNRYYKFQVMKLEIDLVPGFPVKFDFVNLKRVVEKVGGGRVVKCVSPANFSNVDDLTCVVSSSGLVFCDGYPRNGFTTSEPQKKAIKKLKGLCRIKTCSLKYEMAISMYYNLLGYIGYKNLPSRSTNPENEQMVKQFRKKKIDAFLTRLSAYDKRGWEITFAGIPISKFYPQEFISVYTEMATTPGACCKSTSNDLEIVFLDRMKSLFFEFCNLRYATSCVIISIGDFDGIPDAPNDKYPATVDELMMMAKRCSSSDKTALPGIVEDIIRAYKTRKPPIHFNEYDILFGEHKQ